MLLDLAPPPLPALDLPDEAAFDGYRRALNVRRVKVVLLVTTVMIAAAWAWELAARGGGRPLLFPDAFYAASIGGRALFVALLEKTRLARAPIAATAALTIAENAAAGVLVGREGGLSSPAAHVIHLGIFLGFLPMAPLVARALFSLSPLVPFIGGLWLSGRSMSPSSQLGPFLAILIFAALLSVFSGHMTYVLMRRNFFLGRSEERTSQALQDLNGSLHERVEEQTEELRLLVAHLDSAREQERARLSRELHDELGQELTALRYALTLAKRRFDQDASSIEGNLKMLEELLGRTTQTVRTIVSELRPRVLEDLGLDAAIAWLLQRTEKTASVTCRLAMKPPDLRVDLDLSVAAFRVLQEALTNAARHAQASLVEVDVALEDGELRLCVRDDGVGLPEHATQRSRPPGRGGVGLIGMRERAVALGGTLRIESAPGKGTAIHVALPAPRPAAPAREEAP